MKHIAVTHSSAALGWEALSRQDDHQRLLDARRLAERVAAAAPSPRSEAAGGRGAPESPTPGSPSPEPDRGAQAATPPSEPTPTATSRPTVIEVGAALARQAERRAERERLDRLVSALDRALVEQPYTGRASR